MNRVVACDCPRAPEPESGFHKPGCYFSNPAHSVPFAHEPDKTVTEKFTVTITTPETPNYCGCPRCMEGRREFWSMVILTKLQQFADNSDPLRIFPEKHHFAVDATNPKQ